MIRPWLTSSARVSVVAVAESSSSLSSPFVSSLVSSSSSTSSSTSLFHRLCRKRNSCDKVLCYDQNRMVEKYIDIGVNLLDGMYQGDYHGKTYHTEDMTHVLARSWESGLDKIIVTSGTLQEAQRALALCRHYDNLYTTVGVHPTRGDEWASHEKGPEAYMHELEMVIQDGLTDGKVVAIGECGLDYDRTQFCTVDVQMACFKEHFKLAEKYKLPMFLHSRSTKGDMVKVLNDYHSKMPKGGVVHSFDGSLEDLKDILKMENVFIGINGCSLKTEDNLRVASQVPLDRLMLETDAPWCGVRPTHASSRYLTTTITAKDKKKHDIGLQVKGRNEPCNIVLVCEAMAGIMGIEKKIVAQRAYENSIKMFFDS